MIRYVVPAALAAFALCAPVASQAQQSLPGNTGPVNVQNYPEGGNVAAAPNAYGDEGGGYFRGADATPLAVQPMPVPMASAPPPGVVWVQGHYNWDPSRQTYAWIEGQYVQAPRLNAQWVAGHWMQTPSAWIWVDGSWN